MKWALSRRRLLGATGAALLMPAALPGKEAWAKPPPRIVTTSWYLAELLLSIGIVPLAISETEAYRRQLPEPMLPPGVVDLGAVWEPNPELLLSLAPDLILLPPEQAVNEEVLSRIAPTRRVPSPDAAPASRFAEVQWTWRTVAGWLGRNAAAEQVIRDCDARIGRARSAIAAAGAQRAVYLVDLGQGGRQIDVFGAGSILHETLLGVGLRNAWTDAVEDYGWVSVGIERLGDPEAQLIHFDDDGDDGDDGDGPGGRMGTDSAHGRSRRMIERSSLWRALPLVKAGRVKAVPSAFVFGGLLTAARFAERLEHRLRPGDLREAGTSHG